jgi:hypothetical protein
MNHYLRTTEIIDWKAPAVLQCAHMLAGAESDMIEVARWCSEWTRCEGDNQEKGAKGN